MDSGICVNPLPLSSRTCGQSNTFLDSNDNLCPRRRYLFGYVQPWFNTTRNAELGGAESPRHAYMVSEI